MKKYKSRREFLSFVGRIIFIFVASTYSISRVEKIQPEDEYIIINGWLLKKEDLHDI